MNAHGRITGSASSTKAISSAVAVDCLRRENVKPKSYTVEQLEKDLVSDHNGLTNNAKALDCLVTSGVNVTPADETPWQPFQ